jgi:hypothetical protein
MQCKKYLRICWKQFYRSENDCQIVDAIVDLIIIDFRKISHQWFVLLFIFTVYSQLI